MKDRYQVTLAYDGTDFHGSQRQPNVRTVQGEVEKALQEIAWKGRKTYFAGRTDAGVHAAGQVAAFDLDWAHTREDLQRALNANLPRDISAKKVVKAKQDFQPRFDALYRRYRYRIRCDPIRDPLQDRYIWRVWPDVNLSRMREASSHLLGVHDFGALGSPHQEDGSTIREVREAVWRKEKETYTFQIVGNAFLYHMVRHILILLVQIGQGRKPVNRVAAHLDRPGGPPARGLAPARGLTLLEVVYPENEVMAG
jgi:tRNA pseudouridine38-40 synthase